jgi:hypothetical protein
MKLNYRTTVVLALLLSLLFALCVSASAQDWTGALFNKERPTPTPVEVASTDAAFVKSIAYRNTLYRQIRDSFARYLPPFSSDPSNPQEGQIYANTTSHVPKFYNGSSWLTLQTTPVSPGGSNGSLQVNSSGSFAGITLGGDCTFSTPNITCTKTNGASFAPSATTDTTNGSNISSGTISIARLPITYASVAGSNATTTNTTATDIPGLSIALAANAMYQCRAGLTGNGADANGAKFAVNFSAAGAAVEMGIMADVAGTGMRSRRFNSFNTLQAQAFWTSATDVNALIDGYVITGANVGNFTIQYAKVTSGTLTVYIGSYVSCVRVA